MKRLILVRHGQSEWNREGRFTGWHDVALSELGRDESRQAGQLLMEHSYNHFRVAYCSLLKRSIDSLSLILEAMHRPWVDVYKDWRLNEKHYGSLQGLYKADVQQRYGTEQVLRWRRSFDDAPPPMGQDDERAPHADTRYDKILTLQLPLTESLKQTSERILPFWESTLLPKLMREEELLVVAHGNSLRALLMHIKDLNEEQILLLNVPLALPLIVEFDDKGAYLRDFFLGDEAILEARLQQASQI